MEIGDERAAEGCGKDCAHSDRFEVSKGEKAKWGGVVIQTICETETNY